MKKIFLSLLFSCLTGIVFAQDNIHNAVYDGSKIYYSSFNQTWSFESSESDELVFIKKLIEGDGGYSIYYKEDGSLGFVLNTDYELINNGKLIIVDNNNAVFRRIIKQPYGILLQSLNDYSLTNYYDDRDIANLKVLGVAKEIRRKVNNN